MSLTTPPAAAMDVDTPRKYLPAATAHVMKEGTALTLLRWSALQMAVDNDWGGRNSRLKADQLVDEILSWLMHSKELYIDDLEVMLEESMLSLNTVVDDGSIEEIAESLMLMHEELLEGNYSSVENLRRKPRAPPAAHMRQALNDEEDDSEDEDEDEDRQGNAGTNRMSVESTNSIPSSKPPTTSVDNSATSKTVESEEGWTTVSSSRKKKAGR